MGYSSSLSASPLSEAPLYDHVAINDRRKVISGSGNRSLVAIRANLQIKEDLGDVSLGC